MARKRPKSKYGLIQVKCEACKKVQVFAAAEPDDDWELAWPTPCRRCGGIYAVYV